MQLRDSKNKRTSALRGLYLLTPDGWSTPELQAVLMPLLASGFAMLQYRDKHAGMAERLVKAKMLLALCRHYHTPLIINDDIALARQVAADGVHLGRADADPQMARQQLGEHAIIGCSCYGELSRAKQMCDQGADYLAFGSLFASLTKPSARHCSLDTLSTARQFRLPLIAIGGITLDNAAQVLQAGADMLAVISDVFAAADPLSRLHGYQELLQQQPHQQQEQQ